MGSSRGNGRSSRGSSDRNSSGSRRVHRTWTSTGTC
jgi:hypothetical protein